MQARSPPAPAQQQARSTAEQATSVLRRVYACAARPHACLRAAQREYRCACAAPAPQTQRIAPCGRPPPTRARDVSFHLEGRRAARRISACKRSRPLRPHTLTVRQRRLLRAADVRRTCRRRKPGEGSAPCMRCAPRCRGLSPSVLELGLNSRYVGRCLNSGVVRGVRRLRRPYASTAAGSGRLLRRGGAHAPRDTAAERCRSGCAVARAVLVVRIVRPTRCGACAAAVRLAACRAAWRAQQRRLRTAGACASSSRRRDTWLRACAVVWAHAGVTTLQQVTAASRHGSAAPI